MSGSHSTRGAMHPLAHGLRLGYKKVMNALIAKAQRMALSKGQRPSSKGTSVVYFLRSHSGVPFHPYRTAT